MTRAMLTKIIQRNIHLIFVFSTLIWSCKGDKKIPDVSNENVTIHVSRFENDFFNIPFSNADSGIEALKIKYGSFADLFLHQITTLGSNDSILTREKVKAFIEDTNFRKLLNDVKQEFPDFKKQEEGLKEAFQFYKYYFPNKSIPEVVTLISAFSYPVIADSTHLGISLDMYMGEGYRFYNTLQPPLPEYLRKRMTKEYLVCDAMKGWAMSDYGIDETTARMIDMMMSQGKILFFLDKVLPHASDTIKYGYSKSQLDFCNANEARIWSFFVDQDMLYSTDPNNLMKYANDGPTTNGFPKESPGNIAQFIGKKIIDAYMEKNPDITLQQLMENNKFDEIMAASKYKPAK